MEDLFVHKEQVKKNITANTLVKGGSVEEAFKYDKSITYPKTGKEIRSKLTDTLSSKAKSLNVLAVQLEGLREFIGAAPDEATPDWYYNEQKEAVSIICPFIGQLYCDKMAYLDRDFDTTSVPRGFVDNSTKVGYSTTPEQANACNKYNSLIRGCCTIASEIAFCKTLYDATEEKKTYQLNLSQLQALNF